MPTPHRHPASTEPSHPRQQQQRRRYRNGGDCRHQHQANQSAKPLCRHTIDLPFPQPTAGSFALIVKDNYYRSVTE